MERGDGEGRRDRGAEGGSAEREGTKVRRCTVLSVTNACTEAVSGSDSRIVQ